MAERVAVIGAGQMGNGIAHVFAQNGFDVTMIDVSADALERGKFTIASNLDRQIKKGTLQAGEKDAILGRIATSESLDAARLLDGLRVVRRYHAHCRFGPRQRGLEAENARRV